MSDSAPHSSSTEQTSLRNSRLAHLHECEDKQIFVREARPEDAGHLKNLFDFVYNGKYPDNDLQLLSEAIADQIHYLCVVAELRPQARLVGCMMVKLDVAHHMGKAERALVLPEFRKKGLAACMLRIAVEFLCEGPPQIDVLYATSRSMSIGTGAARVAAEAGMTQMGLFPNAVQVEEMEHLNLDIYLSPRALQQRSKQHHMIAPFAPLYGLAMRQLQQTDSATLAQLSPLPPSRRNILPMILNEDPQQIAERYHCYEEQDRQVIFPFHFPNLLLTTEDGCTEVFVWHEGTGKRAAIVGYRSDRANVQEILRAVAATMEAYGAAYLELLVPANDPLAQQCAYAARFIPCAYFPAMRLTRDGRREDFFVLSRTFRLLDFSDIALSPVNCEFLRSYMAAYYQLYIEPILGPLTAQASTA